MELLLLFVKLLDQDDLKENEDAFQLIDVDHSGQISAEECIIKMQSINQSPRFEIQINEADVYRFIDNVDTDNSGQISFSQFLCATLTTDHFTDARLEALFNDIDSLRQGFITKQTLLTTFKRNARTIEMT